MSEAAMPGLQGGSGGLLIDTHCHLDAAEFQNDLDAVLTRARAGGVGGFILPAVAVPEFAAARAVADRHPDVRFALGIHPLYVDAAGDDAIAQLRSEVDASISHPRFIGIGEIGLDHFVPGLDRARQQHFLVEQLRIARDFELPVILHTRRSVDLVAKALRQWRPIGGIAHAFNGSVQQAGQLIDLGFALGFGGAMTFSRALNIRRLAAELPIEGIVLETDAPDIAPSWVHPGRNSPAELPRIAAELASMRGLSPATVAAATTANAGRVLPRLLVRQ